MRVRNLDVGSPRWYRYTKIISNYIEILETCKSVYSILEFGFAYKIVWY